MTIMTINCNHCGASYSGSVSEAIGWDKGHATHCTERKA